VTKAISESLENLHKTGRAQISPHAFLDRSFIFCIEAGIPEGPPKLRQGIQHHQNMIGTLRLLQGYMARFVGRGTQIVTLCSHPLTAIMQSIMTRRPLSAWDGRPDNSR
jgi:hypothetical protein